jgi:TRAP-type mannitol/chloroaromatic compound transport system substrate-binding protein
LFTDFVKDMSGGRLVITNNASGAIVDGLKEMRAVHEGVLDCTMTGSHYHTSEIGLTGDLFNLYPAGTSPQEFAVWYYEAGGEALHQEMYDRKSLNVKSDLGMFTSAELFGWFAEPVKTMNDFKGMKFRTAGIWGEMLNEAGAAVVTMPGGEIYESMQRGVIDAFEFSTPGVDWSAGFHELGAYVHGPGIHAPQSAFEFLVNKDQWDALPADLQAIVDHACEATVIRSLAMVDYSDTLGIKNLRDYGTEFVYVPEDVQTAIVAIANKKYDEIAAEDEFFAKVLESHRSFLIEYRDFKAFAQPDPSLMTWNP